MKPLHPRRINGPGFDGSDLVSRSSLLRRLPAVMQAEPRMRIDALVYSADVLSDCWRAMVNIAAAAGAQPSESQSSALRIGLISRAWTIVDHLHAARQICNSLVEPNTVGPAKFYDQFMFYSEPARFLRNKMDHLAGNLRNRSSIQGQRSALFGSLGYFLVTSVSPFTGSSIVVQAGQVQSQEQWHAVNPAGRQLRGSVDFFTLNAFEEVYELGPPIEAYKNLLERWEVDWVEQIDDQVNKILKDNPNYNREQIMQHSGGGFILSLAMKFGTDRVDGENP